MKVGGQAQDSLIDQLKRVAVLANKHGEYDAADFIMRLIRPERPDPEPLFRKLDNGS